MPCNSLRGGVVGADKMRIENKYKNKGNTIYLGHIPNIEYYFQIIDLLPLLFDKIISAHNSYLGETRWVSKYYSIERIEELCKNQILTFYEKPIVVEERNNRPLCTSLCTPLERWIRDEGYFILGEWDDEKSKTLRELVFEDWEDGELSKFKKQLPFSFDGYYVNSYCVDSDFVVSIDLNKNLMDAFYLNSPLLVHPQLKSIYAYKFESIIKQSKAVIPSVEYPEKIQVLSKFLRSNPLKVPQQLSLDDLIEFRKDRKAIEFRIWLNNVFQEAKSKGIDNAIDISQELRVDFQELCKSYEDRSNLIATTISGMATTIAGIIGGPLGGLVSVPSYLTSLKAVKLLWEKYGTNNWTFFFIKKRIIK